MPDFLTQIGERVSELLIDQLRSPLFSVTSPLYWTHLASALLLAFLVHCIADRRGQRPSVPAFVRRYLPASVLWHPSARADYLFYVANGVVFPLVVAPWLLDDAAVRAGIEGAWRALLGPPSVARAPGPVATVLLTALVFVAFDLGRWIGHWLLHRVPALWAFHRVHHSAEVLTPATTFRVHPVELAVMATTTTLTTAIAAVTISRLHPGASLWQTCSFGAAVALFVFDVTGSLLRHSSVWLSYGPVVERVLISPAQHQIHHSTDVRHVGHNLGFALAIWDGLAKTLYVTRGRESLALGLGDGSEPRYRSLLALFVLPFVELARLTWRRVAARSSPSPFASEPAAPPARASARP